MKIKKYIKIIILFIMIGVLYSFGYGRNSNVFVNQDFRDSNPSDGDVVDAILGSENQNTIYTDNWQNNSCDFNNMNIVYIDNYQNGGANQIPSSLNSNTIYILESGKHISSQKIIMNNCSLLLGIGNVNLYSDVHLGSWDGFIEIKNKENFVLDNIKIDGLNTGIGTSHDKNYAGIYISDSSNGTINKVESFNHSDFGLYLRKSSYYNKISNSKFFYNNLGVYIYDGASYNKLYNVESFNNNSHGIQIRIEANNNFLQYVRFYNNASKGLIISQCNYTDISHMWSYNNASNGLHIYDNSRYSFINNSKVFNNGSRGIQIQNTSNNSGYNSINNTQVFNNDGAGIDIAYSDYNIINNVMSYNNDFFGISLYYANNNIYNNILSFNNDSFGFRIVGSTGTFYGFFNLFENTTPYTSFYPNMISGENNLMGWENGFLDLNGQMDCSYIDNPLDHNGDWFNTDTNCNQKGLNNGWLGYTPIYFEAGGSLLKQIQPVKFQSGNIVNVDIEVDNIVGIGDLGDDLLYGTGIITLTTKSIAPGVPIKLSKKSAIVKSNQNNKSSLLISGIDAVIASGNTWDGILMGPNVVDKNSSSAATIGEIGMPENASIIETIEAGSTNTSLIASGGNFLIEHYIGSGSEGDIFNIYRSSDGGSSWSQNDPDNQCILDEELICRFNTDHLSNFTFLGNSATFFINNDDINTLSTNVTLNIDVIGAQQMRFANDSPSAWSAWEPYSNSKSWTLSAGTGTKTVYAQFDSNGDDVSDAQTQDFINYSDGPSGCTNSNNPNATRLCFIIQEGTNTCTWNATGYSFGAYNVTSAEQHTSINNLGFSCELYANASATITLSDANLSGSIYSIDASNLTGDASGQNFTEDGSLTAGASWSTSNSQMTSQELYTKTEGQIGNIIQYFDVDLTVPAGQPADSYTADLTITIN